MSTPKGHSKSVVTRAWSWILYRAFRFALRRLARSSGACANRHRHEFCIGHLSVEVVMRDRLRPEGYSREELISMLGTVRKHETKMGWRVPENPPAAPSSPAPLLPVQEAAHLLRALTRVQVKLDALATSRFSASHDADYESADSLLLGIGWRVAKLAGGFGNLELLAAWKNGLPLKTDDGSSDKTTSTTLPTDLLAYQSLDRRARSCVPLQVYEMSTAQIDVALDRRRALIRDNQCPLCQQQMVGSPRACPVHGEQL